MRSTRARASRADVGSISGWVGKPTPINFLKLESADGRTTVHVKSIGLAGGGGRVFRVIMYHSPQPEETEARFVGETMAESAVEIREAVRDLEALRDDPGELRPDGGTSESDRYREWDARIRSEMGQETFRQASETWGGYKGQVEKAIEELEELTDALEAELEGDPDHSETLKEFVDVRVMLGQLALYRTEPALEDAVDERMDRLEAMIEDASHLRSDGGTSGSERLCEPGEHRWVPDHKLAPSGDWVYRCQKCGTMEREP